MPLFAPRQAKGLLYKVSSADNGQIAMKKTLLLLVAALNLAAGDFAARFAEISKSASPSELYALLFALPKGGDLHQHNGLSVYADVWYSAATSGKTLRRNNFYTLTKSGNCPGSDDCRTEGTFHVRCPRTIHG